MTGLENITHFGGLTMSFAGITIVFVSLTVLLTVISRIHKLLDLWDNKNKYMKKIKAYFNSSESTEENIEKSLSSNLIKESAKNFKIISSFIGEPFHLTDLIKFAEKRGLISPCPKKVVEELLKASLIVESGDQKFCWNNNAGNF